MSPDESSSSARVVSFFSRVLLIVRGKSTREIANGLNLSVKTVETHRAQIMKRLQIYDVAGLVLFCVRERIISLDD